MNFKKLMPEVIKGKNIIIRVDFNVPFKGNAIKDNTRMVESLPTLKFLIEHEAKNIHILTHIGRPKEGYDPELSTQRLVSELQDLLGHSVEFRPDFSVGTQQIQLHENTRFYPGEKKNDPLFVKQLYTQIKPDIFINDGFSVSHRSDASVVGLAEYVPCFSGFLLEKEIEALSPFLTNTKMSGLTVIISGVKMETKIPVLEHFARIADNVILGGGIANTFMVAQGYHIGTSLYEEEYVKNARRVLKIANEHKTGFHIPVDVVCADTIDSDQSIPFMADGVLTNMSIFDIGPKSIKSYCEILQHSQIIIWNGPLGVMEKPLFEMGTFAILECIKNQKNAKTIIGGGDTLKALKKWNIAKSEFSHVSTGGGAMLEFLEGKTLPGIAIVQN